MFKTSLCKDTPGASQNEADSPYLFFCLHIPGIHRLLPYQVNSPSAFENNSKVFLKTPFYYIV